MDQPTTDLTALLTPYILVALIPIIGLLLTFICIVCMTSYLSQILQVIKKISSDLDTKFNYDIQRDSHNGKLPRSNPEINQTDDRNVS